MKNVPSPWKNYWNSQNLSLYKYLNTSTKEGNKKDKEELEINHVNYANVKESMGNKSSTLEGSNYIQLTSNTINLNIKNSIII